MQHAHTKKLAISLLVALLLPVLVSCGQSTPDPCAPAVIKEPLTALMNADREFTDTVSTASNTARIGLAPVLLSMQKTRRETEDLETPACLTAAKTQLLLYMINAIESFSKFARQANDYEVYMKDAASARAEFLKEVERLVPTPTPAQ